MYHYNLLPKDEQKRTKRWILIKQLTIGLAVLNIILLACSVVLWNANRGLQTVITTVDAQAEQSIRLRSSRASTYDIDSINQEIVALRSIQNDHVNILALTTAIADTIPTDVVATHIAFDAKTRTITLNGVAETRDALQALRDNLQKQTAFAITAFPYDALTEPTNIEFQIVLTAKLTTFLYE
jgi:Tfp pilus assembly protein PilN